MERLYLLRRVSCAKKLHQPAETRRHRTSAGGILISRAITERPDLFAAAVCNAGIANAMRMEFSPNGSINTTEFGTVKDSAQCQALYEMDGVQHVQKEVKYPALLGVAGWNDPRVVPWEPGEICGRHACGNDVGKTSADEGELRQRPLHGGKDCHLQKFRGSVCLHALANGAQRVSTGGLGRLAARHSSLSPALRPLPLARSQGFHSDRTQRRKPGQK